MNKCKLKQTFALLAAMTMMSCAAACSGETEAVGAAGGDVPQITAAAAAESSEVSLEAEQSDLSVETNLPEGMTMDDLKNMIQINGKTLSMPTTLNDILALDEGFSYKLLLEDSFDSIDEYFEEYDVAVYTIYYNDIAVMNANINIDDRTDDMIDAKVYTIYNINASDCDLNGFDFSLSCGIDFTSSKEDIMEIFGYTETKPTKSNILEYVFYDKEQEIALDLHISPETNLLSNFNYFIY